MFPVQVALGADHRRHPRRASTFAASAQTASDGHFICKVLDISQSGLRLETFSALEADATIEIVLLKRMTVSARVVWSNEFEAGCSFETALSQVLVDLIVRSRGTGTLPAGEERITYI